jgi:hypothetical protein
MNFFCKEKNSLQLVLNKNELMRAVKKYKRRLIVEVTSYALFARFVVYKN